MFVEQSEILIFVNRLNTEESVIPYEYHHFDFCPIHEENSPVENLGQVVFGERIRPGPFKIKFLKDVKCQQVTMCTLRHSHTRNRANAISNANNQLLPSFQQSMF